MELALNIAIAAFELLQEMSPYLLLGLFAAGVLHVFMPLDFVARHLGNHGVGPVIKAVVLGIPLPLCSCSVVPAAVALRDKGAHPGATVSFLIATPITGVDSILATYSLMGLAFTLFRIIAAAATAMIAGVVTNLWVGEQPPPAPPKPTSSCCHQTASGGGGDAPTVRGKIRQATHYVVFTLMGDIWRPLAIGLLIGGLIVALVPNHLVEGLLGKNWLSMLVMLGASIPMYVCATGSIPVAAALMLKGMTPGAALVFLLCGPATNAVTITIVGSMLGKRVMGLYVATIAVMSLALGHLFNLMWNHFDLRLPQLHHAHTTILPLWASSLSTLLLVVFTILAVWHKMQAKRVSHNDVQSPDHHAKEPTCHKP